MKGAVEDGKGKSSFMVNQKVSGGPGSILAFQNQAPGTFFCLAVSAGQCTANVVCERQERETRQRPRHGS